MKMQMPFKMIIFYKSISFNVPSTQKRVVHNKKNSFLKIGDMYLFCYLYI
jgi:hypothetical protein